MAPAAATAAAHSPSFRSQFNPYNFLVCFLVSLGQVAFGYPASIIGTTLGEPPFLVYMGLVDENGPTKHSQALIGTMNGLFQAGAVLGILSASYIMDGWGRKAGIVYCSFFSLVGGALLCGSRNVGMFIAARFIAGWGSWGFLAVSKWHESRAVKMYMLTPQPSTHVFGRTGTARSARFLRRHERRQHRLRIRAGFLHGHGLLLRRGRHSKMAWSARDSAPLAHNDDCHCLRRSRVSKIPSHEGQGRRGASYRYETALGKERSRPGVC